MKIRIETLSRFIISLFAMIITLVSYALLSAQIIFISLVWMLTSFLHHLNDKLTNYISNYGVER